jgi:hypothetical protein
MYSVLPKSTLAKFAQSPDTLALLVRKMLLSGGTKNATTLDGKSTTGGILNLYLSLIAASDSTDTSISVIPYEVSTASISVYPNPFSNVINVSLNKLEELDFQYELISMSGAILSKGKISNSKEQIRDLQALPSGLYYLRLSLKGVEYESKKIVKL